MTELLFIVEEHEGGIYNAKAVGTNISTQAATRQGVENSVRKAVREYFRGDEMPKLIHLHFVHDKTISSAEIQDSSRDDLVKSLQGSVLKDTNPFGPASSHETVADWRTLRGTLVRYDAPTEPVGVEDWEALK